MSGSPHRFRVSRLGSCWYLLCDYTKQNNWATMGNVAVRAECRDIAPVICYSYTLVAVNWMTYKILLLAHCREILFAILCRISHVITGQKLYHRMRLITMLTEAIKSLNIETPFPSLRCDRSASTFLSGHDFYHRHPCREEAATWLTLQPTAE